MQVIFKDITASDKDNFLQFEASWLKNVFIYKIN